MIHLKSLEEARASDLPPPLKALVLAQVEEFAADLDSMGHAWDPQEDGWFVVLEPGEESRPLEGFGWEMVLMDLLFEFFEHDAAAGCFWGAYIPTNNWGVTIFVPDGPGLDRTVREWLIGQCAGSTEGTPWAPQE